MYDIRFINGQVYMDSKLEASHVYVTGDKIAAISTELFPASETYDLTDKWLLPGMIDPHVHFALDIGTYVSADDFKSGSITAAYGGVTTFIDFLDPIYKGNDLQQALAHRKSLAKEAVVDYMFHATVANPKGEVDNIIDQMKLLNLCSVKLFTTYSDSNRRTYDDEIKALLAGSKSNEYIVLAHIENDDMIRIEDKMPISALNQSRPSQSETTKALELASYVEETGGRLYMVHLSSGNTLKALIDQHEEILSTKQMVIESCPHYFYLTDEKFSKTCGYQYLLAPPLRSKEEQALLYELKDRITTIGTDHCPFMDAEKNHPYIKGTPMGMGGIEYSLPLMYSVMGLDAIDKMSKNPAEIYGLYPNKGSITLNTDADLCVFDPSVKEVIDSGNSNCDFNVYKGIEVTGKVESTLCRGTYIIKRGKYIKGHQGLYLKE